MQDTLLTVMTPTYNRAHTLPACYCSLCEQSDKRFLWMIIDDGSEDDTEAIVDQWIAEKKLRIKYIKKENGGKTSALNAGFALLDTRYAACLDSDDTFYPDSVQKALGKLEDHDKDQDCCGILALRNNPDGTVMGGKQIPPHMAKVTAADVFLRLNLRTELICFYKTDILKQYRFPEFEGEKFVSPAWMQYEVTQKYYFATSWDKLCCCEYLSDGLTKNKRKVIAKNPHGYTCVKRYSFDLAPRLRESVKHGIMYDCGCILGKDKNWLAHVRKKGLAVILYPVAYIVSKVRFQSEEQR